jgi:hypothetical protein
MPKRRAAFFISEVRKSSLNLREHFYQSSMVIRRENLPRSMEHGNDIFTHQTLITSLNWKNIYMYQLTPCKCYSELSSLEGLRDTTTFKWNVVPGSDKQ